RFRFRTARRIFRRHDCHVRYELSRPFRAVSGGLVECPDGGIDRSGGPAAQWGSDSFRTQPRIAPRESWLRALCADSLPGPEVDVAFPVDRRNLHRLRATAQSRAATLYTLHR